MSVAIDWGSTSFRAYHFSADNQLLGKRVAGCGIKEASGLSGAARERWFEERLQEHCRDWIDHDRQAGDASAAVRPALIFSGMITSRNGWFETPYVNCPVSVRRLFENALKYSVAGVEAFFLPGVAVDDGRHCDVMRGEELQLIGVTAKKRGTVFVLPGTHSKWVRYDGDTLAGFQTLPTGELYATVLDHTLIGALAAVSSEQRPDGDAGAIISNAHPELFRDTVLLGFQSEQFLNDLFSTRSRVLLEKMQPAEVRRFLSALLIGREFREATRAVLKSDSIDLNSKISDDSIWQQHLNSLKIQLIGEPTLCELYAQAAQVLGIDSAIETDDTAASGFAELLRTGLTK